MAMEASADVESLQKPVYEGDGCVLFLEDRLEKKEDEHEKVLNHLFLQTLLENLEEKEKVLIKMRYFQEKTQSEIARELGMSQVQVSRSEKKILQKLRSEWKNNRIK